MRVRARAPAPNARTDLDTERARVRERSARVERRAHDSPTSSDLLRIDLRAWSPPRTQLLLVV
jgi:hypothetical protein